MNDLNRHSRRPALDTTLPASHRLLQPCEVRDAIDQSPMTPLQVLTDEATRAKLWPDEPGERNRPCRIRR